MDAQAKFTTLIDEVMSPLLRDDGFERRRHVFRRRTSTAWQVVGFAKQKWSSASHVEYGDPGRLLASIEASPRPLDVLDPMPILELARAVGSPGQVAAVTRAVYLTIERARELEARAT